jgi:hypothetical protein
MAIPRSKYKPPATRPPKHYNDTLIAPKSHEPDLADLTGDIATILVGSSKIPFEVPIKLLSKHSPFFQKAFQPSSPFLESTSKTLSLPDDIAGAFACVVRWMYEGKSGLTKDATWLQLSQLWIFADKLLMLELCDDAIRIFPKKFAQIGGNIATSTINYVFANTAPVRKHPLRRMVVDVFAWGGDLGSLRRWMDQYDRGFLSDMWYVLKDLEERKVCTELSMRGQPFYGERVRDYFVSEERDEKR